jgi:hypothetical protein
MGTTDRKGEARPETVAETVRKRIESGGERIWRLADFEGMPFTAVAQTLSRLARQGAIQRLAKGLYYRPRQTVFGPSRPNIAQLRSITVQRRNVFPAGITAANVLGFTSQNGARVELATTALSLPNLGAGGKAVVHTRRPASWCSLSETDAALLDVLRNRAAHSDLSPEETTEKLLEYFGEPGRFDRIRMIAASEPPRVRAMLGAIGQQLGQPLHKLTVLRKELNPLSRFDFGILTALVHAKEWQARERPDDETI